MVFRLTGDDTQIYLTKDSVLYDGADPDMFAGQWERGFHRPLSAVETADARMRLARIGSLRSVPGVGTALSDPVVASIRRSLDDLA